jgi:YVTN family beta-propeller protein
LPDDDVRAMAAELFAALTAVHAVGVVHRDIKPANILLGADGATLIDFGIAHTIDSTRITRTGMVIGSPAFMSPEQAAGADVTQASDVFALAAVLVFASTGVGPFGTGSPAALLLRAADTAPRLDAVPEALRPMVELCTAKDPSARPSAAVLAATLRASAPARNAASRNAAARNAAARPPRGAAARPTGGRTGAASRRVRWLLAAGVAVAIGTTATVVAVRSNAGVAPSDAAPPSAPAEAMAKPVNLTFAGEARDVAFSPDSRQAFVAHGAGLDVVDTATDAVRTMVALENPNVIAISPDGTRAYVGLANGFVQVLDTTTFRSVTSIATGVYPVGIAISPDGRRLYVASDEYEAGVTITVLDIVTNVTSRTVPIGGDGPIALAMSGDGSRLFVKTRNEVVAIATSDDSISSRKPVEFHEIAPAPGAQAYLINTVGGPLTTLNGTGITKDLPSARRHQQVVDLASTPDGQRLYLLRSGDRGESTQDRLDRLEGVDTATGQATTTIRLSNRQYRSPTMRVSPDGNHVYIVVHQQPAVDIIDVTDYE